MKTDQPTGEWTPEHIAWFKQEYPDAWQHILSDAHNAALAADRKGRGKILIDRNDRLVAALAAERKKHLPYISDLEKQLATERKRKMFAFMRENDQLKRQLAAEREDSRYWNEQWVERGAQLAAYKQKAESMLATSKRVNDQLRSQVQTLVDALEWYATGREPSKAIAALAKVKENK